MSSGPEGALYGICGIDRDDVFGQMILVHMVQMTIVKLHVAPCLSYVITLRTTRVRSMWEVEGLGMEAKIAVFALKKRLHQGMG